MTFSISAVHSDAVAREMGRVLTQWAGADSWSRPRIVPVKLRPNSTTVGMSLVQSQHVVRTQGQHTDAGVVLSPLHSTVLLPLQEGSNRSPSPDEQLLILGDQRGIWIGIDAGALALKSPGGDECVELYAALSSVENFIIDRLRSAPWRCRQPDGGLSDPFHLRLDPPALCWPEVLESDLGLGSDAWHSILSGGTLDTALHPWRRFLRIPSTIFHGRMPTKAPELGPVAGAQPRHWFLVETPLPVQEIAGRIHANVVLYAEGFIQKHHHSRISAPDGSLHVDVPKPTHLHGKFRRSVLAARSSDAARPDLFVHRSLLGLRGARPLVAFDEADVSAEGARRIGLDPKRDWTIYVHYSNPETPRDEIATGVEVRSSSSTDDTRSFVGGRVIDMPRTATHAEGLSGEAAGNLRRLLSRGICSLRHEFVARIHEIDLLATSRWIADESLVVESGWGLRGGWPVQKLILRFRIDGDHRLSLAEANWFQSELGRLLGRSTELEAPVDVQVECVHARS